MIQDILYFSTLTISITLANYYKKIDNRDVKRNYGAGIGVLIAFLNCGYYFCHTIWMVWSNIIILKCCDRRYVHQVSLACTWLHLVYLHFNLKNAQYILWIHQTIALRLVGMAFEIHSENRQNIKPTSVVIGDAENMDPTTIDIISYAFFFIGLHKGPYYRYQIFKDHFANRFESMGDFRIITEQKLKKALFCLIVYSLLRMQYSPQIYLDNSFYNYDAEKRYLYNIPVLLMYFLKNLIIMMLCTSVCTEAGFGVYPSKTLPVPGHGPTTRQSLLKSAFSSLAFILWSGASLQQIIVSATLWVYLQLESEYGQLYETSGQMKLPWDIGFSIMRMFCLIYLTPCLIVSDAFTILKYYNSIFWVFHGVLLVLIVGAVVSYKSR